MKYISILLFTLCYAFSFAQVKGIVFSQEDNGKKTPLGYVQIIANSKESIYTDEDGRFNYVVSKNAPDTLIFMYFGYLPDTLILTKEDRFSGFEIQLIPENLLQEVVISTSQKSRSISKINPLHIENINQGELRKAACCNLSESFETNASVDVSMNDAVTGTKKIQLLGLDGQYSQIQFENIPALRGLEQPFGLNSIPGTWVESIQITKGAGNVVNGYESMAGLINVEFLKGHDFPLLFVNLYGNIFGRFEANVQSGIHVFKRWSTGIFAHYSENFMEMDQNKDGFRDMPVGRLFSAMNRWQYEGKKVEAIFGIRAFQEEKFAGQINTSRADFTSKYGTALNQTGLEFSSKTGFLFEKIYRSLGLIANYKIHDLKFDLSNANLVGTQQRIYANLVYDDIIGNTDHKYRTGLSFVYDKINQQLNQSSNVFMDNRIDVVPGAFFEYTYTATRFTGVAGIRNDYHLKFGNQFSPRVHGKFVVTETTDFRFTMGKGWRIPNYMTDNLSLLASNRNWVVTQTVQPEISWNFGTSIVQKFKVFKREASFVVDYYYTFFQDQLIVDRDQNSNLVVFKNLDGKSYSHALQAELEVEPIRNFFVRFAYKFLDIKAEYGNKIQQQVMIPRHRGMVNLAYKTRNKRWEFDLTTSIYGASRLPLYNSGNVTSTNEWTPIYPIVNGQITHIFKSWDFYVGLENLTNYRQKNPIIDAQNPFGSNFDATQVWGPIMGTNIYAGLRYTLKNKNHD